MDEDYEPHPQAAEVDEVAEWILQNLESDGVSCTIAAHALGYALALMTAGQPRNQAELLEGVIGAMRNTFQDAMSAQAEVLGEREAIGATLQ